MGGLLVLQDALGIVKNAINEDLYVYLEVFSAVALHEGVTCEEAAAHTSRTVQTVYRIIRRLEEVHGVLSTHKDGRARRVYLSDKGKTLKTVLEGFFN